LKIPKSWGERALSDRLLGLWICLWRPAKETGETDLDHHPVVLKVNLRMWTSGRKHYWTSPGRDYYFIVRIEAVAEYGCAFKAISLSLPGEVARD
jgi:hypothetical protein